MSFAEMIVPYRDATLDHYRRTAFDIGEWGLGFMTTSLELGCDCLGEIRYLDAVVHDSRGEPQVIRNAICIHEEDDGILWKHVDERTGAQTRRARRLVISFHVTVANYEYLDLLALLPGREHRVRGARHRDHGDLVVPARSAAATGTLVDQRTYAPYHQHFIVARLDLDIDGVPNTVFAVESRGAAGQRAPIPTGWPWSPARRRCGPSPTAGRTTTGPRSAAGRSPAPARANGLGGRPAYKLVPGGSFPPLIDESSPAFQRAEVIGHTLWVTPYEPAERWPCGEFPNLSAADHGLPAWTARDRPIERHRRRAVARVRPASHHPAGGLAGDAGRTGPRSG